MRSKHRLIFLMVAGLLVGAALAGCAEPEETGEGDGVFEDTNGNTGVGDTGDGEAFEERLAVIDGRVFECDDTTLQVGLTEGPCDAWVWDEESTEADAEGATQATVNADGTVTIDGATYVCDDDAEIATEPSDLACDEYVLQAEGDAAADADAGAEGDATTTTTEA